MDHQAILKDLEDAILSGDGGRVRDIAQKAMDAGVDPFTAVEEGLSKGMFEVGNRFESGEAFLPELLMAAETFKAGMEVIDPVIKAQGNKRKIKGTVVLGSVKGDVHDLGKDIVKTVLGIHGFDVIDVGVDVSSLIFIEEAKKNNADIIALSAIMTTTMQYQKEVVDMLRDMGMRDDYKVIVGGGPVSQEWCDQIGADGYGATAVLAAELCGKLTGN